MSERIDRSYSGGHISAVELGNAKATPEFLKKMAAGLNISPEQILPGSRRSRRVPILQEEPVSSVRLVEQMHKGQIREFQGALLWFVRRLTSEELSCLYVDVRKDDSLPRPQKDIVNAAINAEDERRKTQSVPKN